MLRQKQKIKRLNFMRMIIITFVLISISGCTVNMTNYTNNKPSFDMFDYFSGNIRGWGMVQDRKGELLRQFVVDIKGTLNSEGQLVLAEKFHWNDGEISQRTWTISKEGSSNLSGTAGDVIGKATGSVAGNALNWSYQVEIPVSGRTWKISFDDWMFLQPDGVLLNRAEMSKFGFRVGEVTIAFMKSAVKVH